MMTKEEWERLLSNFSFLAQEASRKQDGKSKDYAETNKIKEFHEFLFALARFYTFIHDRDNKVHTFERKGQIDTFLGRIRRTYGISEPSQYMLEYNYEKAILSENQIKPFMEKHFNNSQREAVVQRDFVILYNSGLSKQGLIVIWLNSLGKSAISTRSCSRSTPRSRSSSRFSGIPLRFSQMTQTK